MDTKLIEDLAALRQHGSFVLAAEARHVTHPAFGRRIRALEAWAGVPLVSRGRGPAKLTAAGDALLDAAHPLVEGLARARAQWAARAAQGSGDGAPQVLRVGTGRLLAHTWVAGWLLRQRAALRGHRVELRTAAMAEIAAGFDRGEVDLLVCYEHPALSVPLSGQRFRHVTVARDHLLPVSRCDAGGRPRHELGRAPWIDYADGLSLGRLLQDHRRARPDLPAPSMVCDSIDAIHELVLGGAALAWLPHSLVAQDLRRGTLKALGGRDEQVHFEVRMYRPRARQVALVEAVWDATAR